MRAVQIARFGGPEVLDVVDLPDPTPGEDQQLFDVSTAGVNFADTHHLMSCNWPGRTPTSRHVGSSSGRRVQPAVVPAAARGTCS